MAYPPLMLRSVVICLLLAVSTAAVADEWIKLEGCRIVPHIGNDGDSFRVLHRGDEHVFRLYFVDCPETDPTLEERLAQQAEVWPRDKEGLLLAGKEATDFAMERLSKTFTVHTRWRDARGGGRLPRHFAFVEFEPGKFLCEALTAAGHARVFGASDPRPDGLSEREMWDRLNRLERQAKARRLGAWAPGRQTGSGEAVAPRPFRLQRQARLFSVQEQGRQIGVLRPGAEVWLLKPPAMPGGLVRIRFTGPDEQALEAKAWAHELGVSAEDFASRAMMEEH